MNIADFIEKNIKLDEKPVELYSYQRKILLDQSDFRIINKSRQIGITQLISWEALVYALVNDNELIGIISVSERMAKDVITYIKNAYHSLPENLKWKLTKDRSEELKFENGSRILSLPNNPRTARGKNFTRVYFDELAHYQHDRDMIDAVMPTVSRGGKVTFISTPLGKQGEFFRIWDEADESVSKYIIPYTECEDIKRRIKIIKAKMDEARFRQEYMCEFLDEAISMFPFQLIKSCIDDELKNEIAETKNPLYFGVDFGKKIDSTVIIGIEAEEKMNMLRFMKEFIPPLKYSDASDFIVRNSPNWKPTRILVDQTGVGEKLIEDLEDLGSVVRGEILTRPFKEKIVQNLKIIMQDGKLKIPRDDNLINQLHSLQKKITDSGVVSYKHPTSGKIQHDDYVWALALAVWAKENVSSTGTAPIVLRGSVFKIREDREKGGFYNY